MRLSQIGKGTRGGFSFRKVLEELSKVDPKKAQSTAGKSGAQGLVGKANEAISKLKINKDGSTTTRGPAAIFSRVIEETEKYKDNDKAASLVRGIVKKDAKALKDHHTPKVTKIAKMVTPKKKDKKPVSPGTAAINV